MMVEDARTTRMARSVVPYVLGLCTLAGCVSYSVPPDQSLMQAAEAATQREDWHAASNFWRRAIVEQDRADPRPHLEAARALLALREVEESLRLLDQGIEQFPGSVELRMMRGKLLCERGFRRAAEENFKAVIQRAPNHSEAWLLLAGVQLDLDLPANAAVAVHRYIELAGPDKLALFLLGRVCAQGGDLEGAMNSFEQAFRESGISIEQLIDAATVVTEERYSGADASMLTQACAWADRALERDPQSAEANYVKGMVLELAGDELGAIECYERAVELVDHLLAMTRLAQVFARLGKVDRADRMIDRALALNVHASHRRMLERIRRTWH